MGKAAMSKVSTSPRTLQSLLARGKIVAAPGVYDALSALISEQAGFEALYVSGAAGFSSAGGV